MVSQEAINELVDHGNKLMGRGEGKPFLDDVVLALKPHGYEWLLSATGIAGPGNLVVVFAGPGDFYTACLTHDSRVLWCHSCGGYGDAEPASND